MKDGDVYKTTSAAYTDVTADPQWYNFQEFAEWCQWQHGFKRDWHLDKDLLVKGNKVYSPDACVFLPPEVNCFMVKRKSKRGDLPIGVSMIGTTIVARCGNKLGFNPYLGSFDTPEDAFYAFKVRKEYIANLLAEKYKPELDTIAYAALAAYTVDITD